MSTADRSGGRIDLADLAGLGSQDVAVDEAADVVLELLGRLTGMGATALFDVDPRDGGVQSVRLVRSDAQRFGTFDIDEWEWSDSGCRILRGDGRIFSPDMRADYPHEPATSRWGVAAYLSVPIEVGAERRLVATLCAMDRERAELPDSALDTARLLAGVLARLLERDHQVAAAHAARVVAEEQLRVRVERMAEDEHRIKTGLAVVGGWLGMIDSGNLGPECTAALSTAQRRIEQLHDEVALLIRRARSELADDVADTPVDVGRLARDAVEHSRSLGPGHEFGVEVVGDAWARATPAVVRDVVEHLVDNAVRYGTEPVAVRVVTEEDEVELSVWDGGRHPHPGQHGAGAEDVSAGTGVGLLAVRRLVESMGGSLTVDIGDRVTKVAARFRRTDPPVRL